MGSGHRLFSIRRVAPRAWLRLSLLIGVLAGLVALVVTVDVPDAAQVQGEVSAAGAWSVVVFVLLYAALAATPFPTSVLTVASGLLFGLVEGAVIAIASATVGAWLAYRIARRFGREAVARVSWSKVRLLDGLLRRRGMRSVLIVRLIPLFPFWLVNYAAGISSVRQRDYLVGTVLGIVPGAIGFTAVGAYGTSPFSWPFIAAVCAVVALGAGASYLSRRLAARGLESGTQTEDVADTVGPERPGNHAGPSPSGEGR